MTEQEKSILRELLRTRAAQDAYGDRADVADGTYKVKFEKIYSSVNTNDKPFIGVKSVITDGEYKGDFIIDCIYINEDAFERSMQKVRNLFSTFLSCDLTETDFDYEVILEKLSTLKGREAFVTVTTNEGMKSYEYKAI